MVVSLDLGLAHAFGVGSGRHRCRHRDLLDPVRGARGPRRGLLVTPLPDHPRRRRRPADAGEGRVAARRRRGQGGRADRARRTGRTPLGGTATYEFYFGNIILFSALRHPSRDILDVVPIVGADWLVLAIRMPIHVSRTRSR